MKYPHGTSRINGVLVPLAALRSELSCGCGEFADLPALGAWCAETGQRIVQLLPVNDTGSQSSPYSALSAFALHPIYVRISDLPEYAQLASHARAEVDAGLEELRHQQEAPARFDYEAVLGAKEQLLRRIYDEQQESILTDRSLSAFLRSNAWVKAYAIFRTLKGAQDGLPWTAWGEHREMDQAGIERLWKRTAMKGETRFHLWLQMRLAEQFGAAATALGEQGVALKGDIPILMNEDSVDAWLERDIFRPELRAGAPPDMFTALGQNWGFPIYNWERLAERDYDWWKDRLQQAARYYHAYRIDHVLGFFRIWAIPSGNWSGIPGFFWPQHGIAREELHENGFDDGRIRWLSEPHMGGPALRDVLGSSFDSLNESVLLQLPGEDLFNFAPEVSGEQQISDLDLPQEQRDWLLEQWRDRVLLELPDGRLAPTWTFRDCSRYQTLIDSEKDRFEGLVAARGADSNELWADHGRRILTIMRDSTSMLPCAEDLGVVPNAVPRVLGSLGILGLVIPRWAHYWDQPGQPLIPFHEYAELSVCAPSVHDTSTMRGWWEQEDGRDQLWRHIGMDEPAPQHFDPASARAVYRAMLKAPSRIVVFQLQDLLALAPETLHSNPDQERVNIPGSYNSFNWTWRMPITLEQLRSQATLNAEVSGLSEIRAE